MEIGASLVGRLVATQFPDWAGLPIEEVASSGTDNAMFRLGPSMAVRLPKVSWAVGQVQKELEWLPWLAPRLPLPVPVPLAMGSPAEGYPWHWSVCRWIEGEEARRIAGSSSAAIDLAKFVEALWRIDTARGPLSGPRNHFRGVPLAARDRSTRAALAGLDGIIEARSAAAVWDAALRAPAWRGSGVWLHGDLQPGNLLARNDRLSAVIDFGLMGVGDPACDLMAAWTCFTSEARRSFRTALPVDDAAWMRGRGWALSVAVVALAAYLHTNPALAAASRRTIGEVLADGE